MTPKHAKNNAFSQKMLCLYLRFAEREIFCGGLPQWQPQLTFIDAIWILFLRPLEELYNNLNYLNNFQATMKFEQPLFNM
jgi:hypothetical protein